MEKAPVLTCSHASKDHLRSRFGDGHLLTQMSKREQ